MCWEALFHSPDKKKGLAKLWQKKALPTPVTNGGEQTPDQTRLSDTFQTRGPFASRQTQERFRIATVDVLRCKGIALYYVSPDAAGDRGLCRCSAATDLARLLRHKRSESFSSGGLPSRSLLERRKTYYNTARLHFVTAWQPSLFALRSKSEGWRRGELNPCPRRYPRRHLHVYPALRFKEPNVAPAHCRLPSVHEVPSPSGAVAPPKD